MIKTDVSRCFRVLANELRRLRIFFEKYDVANPRGSIQEKITAAIKLINEVRPLCESAGRQPLHSRNQRRLKEVAADLSELVGRLSLLKAAAQVAASTKDNAATAMKLAPPAISKLEKRLVALAGDDIQLEPFDPGKTDPQRNPREFVTDPEFVKKLTNRFRHDDARLDDLSNLTLRFMKSQRHSVIQGLSVPFLTKKPSTAIVCTLIPVMFATDRPKVPDSQLLHVDYENRRGNGTLSYGVAEVSIPPSPRHVSGHVERPVLWKLQFREDPKKHITIVKCEETEMPTWKAIAQERMKDAGDKAALVFIHGFNVSFNDAIRRTAQIGRDIDFKGLITAFSWPSQNHVTEYLADEDNADLAVPSCIEFLRVLRQEIGVTTIHVIAHSMGNRVLIESLKEIAALPDDGHILDEVVFAAADYDVAKFKQALGKLKGKARRYTLYGSAKDRAIAAAKAARNDYVRAGDGGSNLVVVEGVESIDATLVGGDLFGLGHSYFSEKRSVLDDLHYVLQSLPPSKRAFLDEVLRDPLRYWVFRP